MKKLMFVVCVCAGLALTSCGRCDSAANCDQDTVTVNDTVVVEQFDTVYAE